ncbi:lasso peptide isopeptide bond-forming cyclase [Methanobacterium sp.]|uniref:lasso peptide isopeptide bond-forming cyclase n=1 Tax=Methanobacterium sp. TaxID=2164 RepID=UPI003159514E
MSAITGIFYRDGRKVDPELIKKMNNRLSHRGPDGSAVWCEGSIALGHQMLWTTPESLHEKLPFEDDSGLVITVDARIDNRDELSKELDIEDNEEVSDSYFILKAYEKWGEDCPDKLLGDFAFVIWDKNEEKLFCARDHMGVKPFYYYLDDKMFVFGTEIKALFCVPGVPRELNEIKIALFLQIEYIEDKICTFYENILRLIPAHSLSIYLNKNKLRKYWELDPNSKTLMNSEEDYINSFREIFEEAVRCRLRSAFPIGFDLSGGLDSSSIVCTAKNINMANNYHCPDLNTFSYIFDEFPQIDERFYIKKVVNTGGINAHYILCDKISPLEQANISLYYQDQPYSNPFLPIIRSSFKEMHNNSIRTLLCGAGGDYVIYTGKNYFLELAVTFQWYKLIKEIRASSKLMGSSVYKKVIHDVIYPLIPSNLKKRLKKFFYSYSYLNKDFMMELKINEKINEYPNNFQKFTKVNTAKKYHYLSLSGDSAQKHFETLDLMSESFSLDLRYPYYDKRLIEFCYSIPTEMKFKVWNRFIQRVAMEGILPSEVQWRTNKASFRPFLTRNLFLFEKESLEMMFRNGEIIKDYMNFEKLKKIYKKYEHNKRISYTDTYFLYLALILFFWLK